MAGFLTPMQMNAGAGLLQDYGITGGQLNTAITNYKAVGGISDITSCQDQASSKLSDGTTISNLYSLGDGVFPGLANSLPSADQSTFTVLDSDGDELTGLSQGALTSRIAHQSSRTIGSDLGVFAQHLSAASAFTTASNEFITSALNADTTFEMNTDVNNLMTGALTDTSLALPTMAGDLLNTGNLIDYNDLRNLGNPMSFVRTYYRQGGGLPVLEKYIRAEGINTAGLTNAISLNDPSSLINTQVDELGTSGLTSYPDGVTPETTNNVKATKQGLGQAIWTALGKIKGEDLATMQAVLDSNITGLETAQDFMDPKKIFPNTYESFKTFDRNGNRAFIYVDQTANTVINGMGEDLYICVPEYIADSNKALSQSLQQIKDVFNITSQQLSQVAENLETTKGLTTIEALDKPVPDSTISFFKNIYGVGSGSNGEFLVTDIIGTCAGYTHREELEQLTTTVGNLEDLGELDYVKELYYAMTQIFADADGYYYTVAGPVDPETGMPTTIPMWEFPPTMSAPLGGTDGYSSRDAATDALITELDSEYSRLATAYPTQAESTTDNISNMSAQVARELTNMPKAGIVPEDTQLGVKNSVLSLVTNLHDYGRDDSLGGTGWILENVASTDFYGESLVAALREGRNIRRLNDASIGNALAIQADTRTSKKATLADATYTVDEAKNNL